MLICRIYNNVCFVIFGVYDLHRKISNNLPIDKGFGRLLCPCSTTYISGKDKPPPRRATAHLKRELRDRIELQFIFKVEVVEGLEIFAHPFLLTTASRHRRYRVAACLGLRIGGGLYDIQFFVRER